MLVVFYIMLPETVISFDDVSKTYKSDLGKKAKPALTELSLSVSQGEVLGIIGPNGAGKSTALKILMGFVKQDSGTVRLTEISPQNPLSHHQLGFLPENPCLYSHLSITDHLKFPAQIASLATKETKKRTEFILKQVDLFEVRKSPIKSFSKGMTQRAALAYALFLEPKVLILDEPMSGLDPIGRQMVVDIIHDYRKKGTTILFCSHILSDVERICDRISIMNRGRIVASTTPKELSDEIYHKQEGDDNMSPLESFFFYTIQNDAP